MELTTDSTTEVSTLHTPYVRPGPALSLAEIIRPVGARASIGFLDEDGVRHAVSYDEFARRVGRAGARLREQGVEPGSPVAVSLRNTLPAVIAALGVWAAGGTLVSLPPQARRDDPTYAERFVPVLTAMGCAHHLVFADTDPVLGGQRRIPLAALGGDGPGSDPEAVIPEIALVQFTSGSLGAPKGVAVRGDVLADHFTMIAGYWSLDPAEDVVSTWLPLFHDLGFVCFFGSALAARVGQTHAEPRSFVRDPGLWMRMLAAERATISGAPNFGFRLASRVPYPADLDLSRMRGCLNAAERVLWSDIEGFHASTGPLGFAWEAIQPAYGLAEGTVGVSCTPTGRGPVLGPNGHVSLGPPLPGNRLAVEGGTLHLGGSWLFDGYWTAAGFAPRTSAAFDTDDAAFIHDGELYVIGRHSDVASIGGHNVFAEDVEAVAVPAAGPFALGCAAFKHDVDGAERFGLVVEIAREAGEHGARVAREVRAAVTTALGTRVAPLLVARQGLVPRTTSGKPRRHELREAFLAGALPEKMVYAHLS